VKKYRHPAGKSRGRKHVHPAFPARRCFAPGTLSGGAIPVFSPSRTAMFDFL